MKRILLVLVCMCLMGCQKQVISVALNFDDVEEMTESNGNHRIYFIHDLNEYVKKVDSTDSKVTALDFNEPIEFNIVDWKPFIESFETLEFNEGKLEDLENGFLIKMSIEGYNRYVEVYEDRMYTYLEDEKEVLITEDDYVKTLYFELSIIRFPGASLLLKKPIIYLYPEEVTDVNVVLETECTLTTTYPPYNGAGT